MSSATRRKELESKLNELKEGYLAAEGSVVKTFRWDSDERSLSIRLVIGEESFRFNVYIPEDFPDMRPMVSIDSEEDDDDLSKVLEKVNEYSEKASSSIGSIVHNLFVELAKVREFKVPKLGGLSLSRSSSRPLKRSLKQSVGGDDEEDEEYEDEYYDEDEGGTAESSRLVKHSKIAQQLYGEDSVLVYPFIDSVRLQLATHVLDADATSRLGIQAEYHEKIVLSVQMGSGDYHADRRIPQVKAIHPKAKGTQDQEVRSGVAEQMENVARQYLERVWPSLHMETKDRPVTKLKAATGLDEETCYLAWEKHNFDFEAANAWLVDNLLSEKSPSSPAKSLLSPFSSTKGKSPRKERKPRSKGKEKEKEKDEVIPQTQSFELRQVRSLDREKENLKELFKKGWRQAGVAMALYSNGMDLKKALEEIISSGGKIEDADTLMKDPDASERNMILELMTYLVRRIRKPIGYCLICDKPIVNQSIKDPTICTIGTCQFNFIELGVCASIPVSICPSSIADDIMNNPDVVDLYISMAVSSATSSRKSDIFNPFPPHFEKGGNKNFDGVVAVLNKVPSVDEMKKHCSSERKFVEFLRKHDGGDGSIYEMLTWILSVNRAALLKMPPNLHIAQMNTSHQYMMTAGNDPAKTAQFKAWRKQYGSFFAFHGSSIENWHSILRVGLLNCSGTKLQTTGAAYGPGVYLAPDSGTSMGYARTGAAWSKSKFENSSSLVCMAIAEVVKHPEAPQTPNPYFVVRNSDFVATRFFLFYPGGMGNCQSVMASSLDLSKYV